MMHSQHMMQPTNASESDDVDDESAEERSVLGRARELRGVPPSDSQHMMRRPQHVKQMPAHMSEMQDHVEERAVLGEASDFTEQ